MKDKTVFAKIMTAVIIAVICIILTVTIALLVGTADSNLFDLSNLNWANVIPVLLIGVFISCVIVGVIVLFLAKDIFIKIKDYFTDTNKDGGKKE